MSVVAILSFAGAKVLHFFEPTKFLDNFFQKTYHLALLKRLPALGFEFKLLIVAGDEYLSELFFRDMPDEFDTVDLLYLLVVADGDGEQQFVILAAIEGTGGDIHIHLLCHHGRLVVDWDVFLVDVASHARLLADMQEFGGETVADIHHRGGTDARLTEFLDDVATSLGLQLALQQVFLAAKIWLEMCQFFEGTFVSTLFRIFHLLVVDRLFALQQLESHVGSTEIAGNADKVGVFGTVAIDAL